MTSQKTAAKETNECLDLDKALSQRKQQRLRARFMQAALERHLNCIRNLLSKIESSSVQEKSWRGREEKKG